MNTYLLDDDVNDKILIFYILKDLNTNIERAIYDLLVTYEVIEVTTQGWTELDIQDNIYHEFYYDINDLYDDIDIFRDQ